MSTTGDRLFDRKVVVMCGSGGVGKTTVAAAFALQAARRGKRVLVVTIDPARRLGTALGGLHLTYAESQVHDAPIGSGGGTLHAMMMDTKTASDELLTKFAPNERVLSSILNNKIYKTLSESLAGTQEYVALGKLYEIMRSERYDMVVVDTAPSRYALDFFEAPARLMDLLDNSILEGLLSPIRRIQSSGFDFLKASSTYIAETLERALGINLVNDVVSFVMSIEGMLGGFRERAMRMHSMLRDQELSALGLVLTASPLAVHEANRMIERLARLQMPVAFAVINRVHPHFFSGQEKELDHFIHDRYVSDMIEATLTSSHCYNPAAMIDVMKTGVKNSQLLGYSQLHTIELFRRGVGVGMMVMEIPFFETDIRDPEGLLRMGNAFTQLEQDRT
ncbi:ArsA family ATPase [bacterium]|nr:ArsA family ATPase [candidate division CSSED10-310 bacterium]